MPVILDVSLSISLPSPALATVRVNYTIKSDPVYNDAGVWGESVELYGASAAGQYVLIPGSQIHGPQQVFNGRFQFARSLEKTFPLTLFLQNTSPIPQGFRPLYYATVMARAKATPFAIQSISQPSNAVPFVAPKPMATLKL